MIHLSFRKPNHIDVRGVTYVTLELTKDDEGELFLPPDDWRTLRKVYKGAVGASDILLELQGLPLQFVRENFTGIPMHAGEEVRWKGPFAEFIAEGLLELFQDYT